MRRIKVYGSAALLAASLAAGHPAAASGSAPVPAAGAEHAAGPPLVAVEAAVEAAPVVDRQHRMEHKFEKAATYYAQCRNVPDGRFEDITPYLRAFTDMEVMAGMMADPVEWAKLMTVVNDPHTLRTMILCASEPVMWDTWMRGLTDYPKMLRTMSRFMEPAVYMRWAMAPMNPQVWTPMLQFMDPNYYVKWMVALANPVFYQPVTAWMAPGWYGPRLEWLMNPQSFAPLFDAMSPSASTAYGTDAPTG